MNFARLYSSDFDTPHIAVVPLGSWEQHGPHLPLDTDTIIASTLCVRALKEVGDRRVLMLAPVNYTASDEHGGFAGTSSIGDENAERTFTLIARSLSENSPHLRGVMFVNGHGGNVTSMNASSSALAHHGVPHMFWTPTFTTDGDLHAGHVETSVIMAIDMNYVRDLDAAVGAVGDPHDIISRVKEHGVQAVSPSGVIGDAAMANATFGDQVLARWTADLVLQLRGVIKMWLTSTPDNGGTAASHR